MSPAVSRKSALARDSPTDLILSLDPNHILFLFRFEFDTSRLPATMVHVIFAKHQTEIIGDFSVFVVVMRRIFYGGKCRVNFTPAR